MSRKVFLFGLWLGLLSLGGFLVYLKSIPPPMERLWNVPPFEMTGVTTASSSPVKAADFFGHPWVADFIYTRCQGPCPLLTAKMAELQKALPPEVRLVSFTVDPDNDTPKVLQRYAARFNADPKRWIFVRGDKDSLYKLAVEGFKFALSRDPSAPLGSSVTHATKFSLVDQKGAIRRIYDSSSPTLVEDLQRDVAALLKEKP